MALVWVVECKTCRQRFPVKSREASSGKSTDQLTPHEKAGKFECPHCHEVDEYSTDEFIPAEGRVPASR
jgi:hypothetical protein